MLAPTADNVVSLLELLQESGNFRRIMLKVAVHGDHVVTFAVCKPSRQRRGLTKVSAQPDSSDTRVDCGKITQSFICKICAPIIHEDKLVFPLNVFHH